MRKIWIIFKRKVKNWQFSITWSRAGVDLPENFSYVKVLFFTQLSYHLMCKLLKKSYMLSTTYPSQHPIKNQVQTRKVSYKPELFLKWESILLLACFNLSFKSSSSWLNWGIIVAFSVWTSISSFFNWLSSFVFFSSSARQRLKFCFKSSVFFFNCRISSFREAFWLE